MNTDLQTRNAPTNLELNGGLILKKDQGFNTLTVDEKAYLVARLYGNYKEKHLAYAESVLGKSYDALEDKERSNCRVMSNTRWKAIENKMGGVRNIISLVGVDIVMIVSEAQRLLRATRMSLDKFGVEHYEDDGATQMKALEFLSKLSGNYSEEIEASQKTSININFGSSLPTRAEDIMSDNMEIVVGETRSL